MSDEKSKLPDIKEITSMTTKLFKDLKKSVGEIVEDYKSKRKEDTKTSKTTSEKKETKAKPKEKKAKTTKSSED